MEESTYHKWSKTSPYLIALRKAKLYTILAFLSAKGFKDKKAGTDLKIQSDQKSQVEELTHHKWSKTSPYLIALRKAKLYTILAFLSAKGFKDKKAGTDLKIQSDQKSQVEELTHHKLSKTSP